MTFAQRLSELMSERGYNSLSLSREIGFSDRLIGGWRKGEGIPTVPNAVKIADFFGVSLDFLSGRSDIREMSTKKEPALEISENGRTMLAYFEALGHDEQLLLIGQAQGLQLAKGAGHTAATAG